MKAIIYETINLYNKEHGILPYRYVGSDQHDKPNYLGSNKKLLADIKNIGSEHFIKTTIFEYDASISNIELRKLESEYQQLVDAAKNPEYYNRTNFSHKGYIETEEEKKNRILKWKNKRDEWWNSLSSEEKDNFRIKTGNSLRKINAYKKGKTYEEIYGEERAELTKNKIRSSGNGMSKKIVELKTGIIFNSMTEVLQYLNINPTSTGYFKLRKLCQEEIEFKYIVK